MGKSKRKKVPGNVRFAACRESRAEKGKGLHFYSVPRSGKKFSCERWAAIPVPNTSIEEMTTYIKRKDFHSQSFTNLYSTLSRAENILSKRYK